MKKLLLPNEEAAGAQLLELNKEIAGVCERLPPKNSGASVEPT